MLRYILDNASNLNLLIIIQDLFCLLTLSNNFDIVSISLCLSVKEKLDCRPCGLHGYKACPQKHFSCAKDIQTTQLLEVFEKAKAYQN